MQLNEATVLLVDDEPALLRIFRRWFTLEGCQVFTAENGLEALEIARAHHIDVLVTDIRMPKMDGIELARRLVQVGGYVPKLIFVSGFGDIDERDCFDIGIEARLDKPVEYEDLMAAVRRSLADRDTLWREPSTMVADLALVACFESLAAAQRDGTLSFGHGGFCIRSPLRVAVGQRLELNIAFAADHRRLAGQGVVRWVAADEGQIGIEFRHLDDEARAWVIGLAQSNGTKAFIPKQSAGGGGAEGGD